MYLSARARRGDFTHHDLLQNLDLPVDESEAAERQVPLLAEAEEEVTTDPPMVEDVLIVSDKEVPTDIPEASEVV